eukprot:5298637-Pyramimonas_sp.AAC.1
MRLWNNNDVGNLLLGQRLGRGTPAPRFRTYRERVTSCSPAPSSPSISREEVGGQRRVAHGATKAGVGPGPAHSAPSPVAAGSLTSSRIAEAVECAELRVDSKAPIEDDGQSAAHCPEEM